MLSLCTQGLPSRGADLRIALGNGLWQGQFGKDLFWSVHSTMDRADRVSKRRESNTVALFQLSPIRPLKTMEIAGVRRNGIVIYYGFGRQVLFLNT